MSVSTKVKQTIAGLKSVQATMKIYETQSQDEETKKVYLDAIEVTDEIVKDLESRIQTLEYQEPQYKGL